MLIKSSRLAGESFKILWQDFRNFFIFQPLSSEPALKTPWTVWRLQVPKSISFEWSSSSLESFTFCKSFKFTFGPSIDNWTIFSISNNLSPSWTESGRSWWVVCPKNSESQYLSYTLFVSSFQKRRQISMSDVCVMSFIESSNDTTYQSDFLTSSLKISFRAIPWFTIYFSLFCSNRIFCAIWLSGNIDWYYLAHYRLILMPK